MSQQKETFYHNISDTIVNAVAETTTKTKSSQENQEIVADGLISPAAETPSTETMRSATSADKQEATDHLLGQQMEMYPHNYQNEITNPAAKTSAQENNGAEGEETLVNASHSCSSSSCVSEPISQLTSESDCPTSFASNRRNKNSQTSTFFHRYKVTTSDVLSVPRSV